MPNPSEIARQWRETVGGGISLIEQIVQTPPRNMEGWRMYRSEYGGHAEACNTEGTIWFPPWFDPRVFEEWYDAMVRE